MTKPTWTERLSRVELRTNVERRCAHLKSHIEGLGAHELLTEALIRVDEAMMTLGLWHDTGRPGAPGDTRPKDWRAFFASVGDSAPEPMRRLGEWLSSKLDDDDWKTADRLVTGAAVALKNEADKTQKLERELAEARAECARLREAVAQVAEGEF